jgi:hypothetical protein
LRTNQTKRCLLLCDLLHRVLVTSLNGHFSDLNVLFLSHPLSLKLVISLVFEDLFYELFDFVLVYIGCFSNFGDHNLFLARHSSAGVLIIFQ